MRLRSLFAVALLAAGCGATIGSDPATEALAGARARWSATGADAYSFIVELQCFCTSEMSGPFEVSVAPDGTTVMREGEVVGDEWLVNVPTDATELFAFVEERIGQADFRAEYDEMSGLPTAVWSDPLPGAVDDELGITVSQIEIDRP
ncbi:MAG: DUF6174 domain-containing protein [Candidatus Limnocylindrus sp.]